MPSSATTTRASTTCPKGRWWAPPPCAVRYRFANGVLTFRSDSSAATCKPGWPNWTPGEYDAIILATAGLIRLELSDRIRHELSPEESLPAGGQGAVGIECRNDDAPLIELIQPLHHPETAIRVRAERAMNRRLEGGCQVPIGCYATLDEAISEVHLRALVGRPDGTLVLRDEIRGPVDQAEQLGITLAERLLAAGADRILQEVYAERG